MVSKLARALDGLRAGAIHEPAALRMTLEKLE